MKIKEQLKDIWSFTYEVFEKFIDDKAPKFGAALSFYTIFSLAPILVIAVTIAGFIFGPEAARGELFDQIEGLIGSDGAMVIQTALKNAQYSWGGVVSIIVSVATILIGSTVVFIDIQESLNLIWKIKPKPGYNIFKGLLKDRLKSFTVVLATGFLLLVSLLVSTAVTVLSSYIGDTLFTIPDEAFEILNNLITLCIIFVLFMMIFKFLPDVHIKWKHVWVGALVTSVLFILGKFLIGLYLGTSTLSSKYGAYGALIILLLWIYYSAQILYLGAEFTQVYANRSGEGIIPKSKFEKFENVDAPIETVASKEDFDEKSEK